MTTAHRPTFHAAVGGKEQGGGRYIAGVSRMHVHDLGSQLSITSGSSVQTPSSANSASAMAKPVQNIARKPSAPTTSSALQHGTQRCLRGA